MTSLPLTWQKNHIQHDKSKHDEIDRHFIRKKIEANTIRIDYVPSRVQLADIFTKSVSIQVFQNLVFKLGCINLYTKLEGECRNSQMYIYKYTYYTRTNAHAQLVYTHIVCTLM